MIMVVVDPMIQNLAGHLVLRVFGIIISIAVQLFHFLIALDSTHPVAGTGPIFHWIFHRLPEEAYPRIIMYNLATTNPIQSDKILPFLGYDSMFTFDVFRLKTNNNKISSSCQIFSKAFLETDKYAGFCGILQYATIPKFATIIIVLGVWSILIYFFQRFIPA